MRNPFKKRNATSVLYLSSADGWPICGYKSFVDCPEVIMAVNVYAQMISSMTIHLMQNGKNGDVRVKNQLSKLVDVNPNPYMTKQTFYEHIIRNLMLKGDGNQVTVPIIKAGLIEKLEPLDPEKTKLVADGSGYYVVYKNDIRYDPDEILHFRINPDSSKPWKGTGFEVALKDVTKAIKQANTTKTRLMENPAPSLVVKVDALTEEFSTPEGRKELSKLYMSESENGKPWIIPADLMEVQQVKPLTMKDLAIKDGLELDKRQVAAMFGVPPFLVGVGDFNKEEFNNFVRTRLMPIAKMIQQELTRQIIIKPDWYFKFNPRSLYAYDLEEIVTAGGEMVDRMAMTRNEWRDWIGMSPDDRMNDLLALENYIPADMLGKQKKLIGEGNE